jgi:hypothetical protein
VEIFFPPHSFPLSNVAAIDWIILNAEFENMQRSLLASSEFSHHNHFSFDFNSITSEHVEVCDISGFQGGGNEYGCLLGFCTV